MLQIFGKLIPLFKNNNNSSPIQEISIIKPYFHFVETRISINLWQNNFAQKQKTKSIDHENNETVTFNLVRSIIIFYLCALQIASCTTIQGTRFSSRDETLPPQIPPTREIFTELQSLGGSSWTRIHPALTCTRTLARCTRN